MRLGLLAALILVCICDPGLADKARSDLEGLASLPRDTFHALGKAAFLAGAAGIAVLVAFGKELHFYYRKWRPAPPKPVVKRVLRKKWGIEYYGKE
jgi:hypothetical protein